MRFTLAQAQALVDAFGGENEVLTVTQGTHGSHSGPGLYAHDEEYPDEGAHFLGPNAE